MRQAVITFSLCALLIAGDGSARAQGTARPFRATSDISQTELVLEGRNLHLASPAPLALENLDPGRYRLSLYRDGAYRHSIQVDAGDGLKLSDRRGGRALLSLLFPGLGQFRDLDTFSGLVPLAQVGTAVGMAIRYQSNVNSAEQVLDSFFQQSTPGSVEYDVVKTHLEDNIWLEQQTRNHYVWLAAYAHFGNILHSGVRRSPYRFELSGTRSVAARYRPPSRFHAGLLSFLYPGLGQTRLGNETRGLIWSSLGFIAGVALVESQRHYDQRKVSEQDWARRVQLEESQGGASPQTRANWAIAQGDAESARTQRNGVLLAVGAFWVLNIADAVFRADAEPMELESGRISALGVDLDLAWVGEGPGLRLERRW